MRSRTALLGAVLLLAAQPVLAQPGPSPDMSARAAEMHGRMADFHKGMADWHRANPGATREQARAEMERARAAAGLPEGPRGGRPHHAPGGLGGGEVPRPSHDALPFPPPPPPPPLR